MNVLSVVSHSAVSAGSRSVVFLLKNFELKKFLICFKLSQIQVGLLQSGLFFHS